MSSKKCLTVTVPAPILPGQVSTVMASCGKVNCRCHDDPTQRHGPYYRWKGVIDGRQTTIHLSQVEAEECARRIINYGKLQAKIHAILENSLRSAPWTER